MSSDGQLTPRELRRCAETHDDDLLSYIEKRSDSDQAIGVRGRQLWILRE
jgi:hypothetical protein